MKPERIKIDEVEYVRSDLSETEIKKGEKLRIVMTDDRGLCLVGHVNLDTDEEFVPIKKARCIIRWGTTQHLAELAHKGPMEKTTLGYRHTQHVARSKISLVINCNECAWGVS